MCSNNARMYAAISFRGQITLEDAGALNLASEDTGRTNYTCFIVENDLTSELNLLFELKCSNRL